MTVYLYLTHHYSHFARIPVAVVMCWSLVSADMILRGATNVSVAPTTAMENQSSSDFAQDSSSSSGTGNFNKRMANNARMQERQSVVAKSATESDRLYKHMGEMSVSVRMTYL